MNVRVNIEDDLHLSGRLAAFARFLSVGENEAIGLLYWVYRETQSREIVTAARSDVVGAIELRIAEPETVLDALVRSKLATESDGDLTIHGNQGHVDRIVKMRGMASAGGKARHDGKRTGSDKAAKASTQASVQQPRASRTGSDTLALSQRSLLLAPSSLSPKKDPDLSASHFSPASNSEDDPRSSLSSDAKKRVGLTPSPSAPVVPEKKRAERSAEQKARGIANNRLYRELYTTAEGHPPTGLDQAFNGMMARFSDKHADGAEQILRWVFERCPDKSFRAKGWPLELIVQQAPRLWRELNNPRTAVENLAAPRQQHQLALAASNDLAFDEYQRRKAERLANAKPV